MRSEPHSFILPVRQQDYRCGDCGTVWQRRGPVATAITGRGAHSVHQGRDPEGWYWCCGRRFRWG